MSPGERGTSLLDLLVYLSLAAVGVFVATTLAGAERLTRTAQEGAFRDSAAAARVLHLLAADLRDATRVAPRDAGPGAVVFLRDGDTAVWYDRPDEPGVLYRKVLPARGKADRGRVVGRGIDDLRLDENSGCYLVRVLAGTEDRVLTIRRRR